MTSAHPSDSIRLPASKTVVGLRANTRTSGGGVVFLRELAAGLAQHPAIQVVVFVVGSPSNIEWPRGVHVVPVDTPKSRYLARLTATRDLQRAVDRNPIDVLICPGTEVTPVAGPAIAIWPLTVAPFEERTLVQLGASQRRRIRWRLLRRLIIRACRHADLAFFSSAYARDLHLAAVPHLQTVPTFIVHPAASLHSTTRQRAQERSAEHLLFVSHLYPYKMVAEMIEAYGRAVDLDPTLPPLVIAGGTRDTTYAERVEQARQGTGVPEQVVLLGEVSPKQLDDLYRRAAVFIFPSVSENAGSYALIDAFAYALPVISSNASSMPEICGPASITVDPSDICEFANAIQRLCSDPQLSAELARLSAERAKTFPSWNEIADAVVDGVNRYQGDIP